MMVAILQKRELAAGVSNRARWCWILVICLVLTGCGGRYRHQFSNGVESLYHIADNGHIRMIYQVKNGKATIHDREDPRAKQYMARMQIAAQRRQARTAPPMSEPNDAEAIRIEQIKAAPKRDAATPIYIFVHEPQMGPGLPDGPDAGKSARQRMQTIMAKQMDADQVVRVTPLQADAEVYCKAYFKKAQAFNIHTRKIVTMNAFHFEVEVRSNYLPEDRYKIEEAGHWMENEWIIQRAAIRANKILKKMIAPNIPADRDYFLSPASASSRPKTGS